MVLLFASISIVYIRTHTHIHTQGNTTHHAGMHAYIQPCMQACTHIHSGWFFDEIIRVDETFAAVGYYGWVNFTRDDLHFAAGENLTVTVVQADWCVAYTHNTHTRQLT